MVTQERRERKSNTLDDVEKEETLPQPTRCICVLEVARLCCVFVHHVYDPVCTSQSVCTSVCISIITSMTAGANGVPVCVDHMLDIPYNARYTLTT